MKNKTLIILLILVVVGTAYYLGAYRGDFQEEEVVEEDAAGIANPAAVYCQEQEGTLESFVFEAGEDAYCVFDDGSRCWQWDFYLGDCHKGQLKTEVLQEGTGRPAEKGNIAVVHYTGTLLDGTTFDSSLDKGEPLSLVIGAGQVIQGWEQGVLGMRIGEKRKLFLGPELAYGEYGAGGVIPPNASLIFEVELLDIQ